MADLSKTAANDALDRIKSRIKGIQERARSEGRHLEDTITMGVAGTVLGGVDRRFGRALLFGFDNAYVTAAGGLILAMSGVGGETFTRVSRNIGNTGIVVSGYRFGWNMAGAMTTEPGAEGAAAAEGGGSGGASDIRGGT
jgi:hypothetical protein